MTDQASGSPKAPVRAAIKVQAMPVRVVMRNYFSTHLLWAARDFGSNAADIERSRADRPVFDIQHRSYVMAAVMAAASFLEAMVNELFQDAADGHGTVGDGYIAPLTPETRALMSERWTTSNAGFERVLDKYQGLLRFAGKPELRRGAQPYQDAALLVSLRDALVHFKPESVAADVDHRFTRKLRRKFPDNGLMAGGGNAWWPDHALGAGCAVWAYRSAKALADTVSATIGIRPNYQRHEASW